MNRSSAKLITAAGVFCCAVSIISAVYNAVGTVEFPNFIALIFFVGGIVLIVISFAYYTER